MERQHRAPMVIARPAPCAPEVAQGMRAALKLLEARLARYSSDAYLDRVKAELTAALAAMRPGA